MICPKIFLLILFKKKKTLLLILNLFFEHIMNTQNVFSSLMHGIVRIKHEICFLVLLEKLYEEKVVHVSL